MLRVRTAVLSERLATSYTVAMFSQRFGRQIIATAHARQRMSERNIADERLVDLIESGEIRHKDETRLWITKSYADRQDNLLCAAAVLENQLVVKTVMHQFEIT